MFVREYENINIKLISNVFFNKMFLSISDSVSVGTYRGKSSRVMARPQRTSVRCPVMVISRNGAGVTGGHRYI